jgi:hypothetical protein
MSKAKELLMECKIKLGIKTDYKLAQAMEINRARISAYMSSKEIPDTYACIRISLILQRNPAEIIAMVEAASEKNEKRRAFWVDFLERVKQAAKLGTLSLIFIGVLSGVGSHERQGFSFRRCYFA